jgi:soluble lytic murein transglycosylase-like protein
MRLGATPAPVSIPQLISNAATQYGVPSPIALEVGVQESGLNQAAVSPTGAIGVMQLEPATAAQLGVDPTNLQQNILGGVKYLSKLFSQFGSWDQALGAYNWGPGSVAAAVAKYGSDWLSYAPAETQNYVESILTAAGGSYSASLTPASVASGVDSTITSLSDMATAASPTTISTGLLLTAFAIGAYILAGFIFDWDD